MVPNPGLHETCITEHTAWGHDPSGVGRNLDLVSAYI